MVNEESLEPRLWAGAIQIVQRLREKGHQALFAGGAVRDHLLGRAFYDIDIATSAQPTEIEALFEQTIPVGKQFGVMIVVLDGINYEVATFRRDAEYTDGRHPRDVTFTDAKEDALRRDFTVNALFLDPISGEVIDYMNGRADLDRGIIRTVGRPEQRFNEDKLRLLRAVRLACQLGFEIETDTIRAVTRLAKTLTQVSQERIRDELLKIITGPDSYVGLRLLHTTGLLEVFLPEVAAMVGVEQPPEFHPEGDVFVHTCLMFELAEGLTESLALGVLLHDVGKPSTFKVTDRIRFDGHAEVGATMASRICHELRMPNEVTIRVVDLVRQHLRFINVKQMRESTLKRFLRQENFCEHLELHRLDCLASHRDLSNYAFCKAKLSEFGEEVFRPEPLLNGHDLIGLGLEPGPTFSKILTTLEDQQLEGAITDREQALEWVKRNWLSKG